VVGGVLVSGGILTTFMSHELGIPETYTLFLAGLGLITMAIFNPKGVAGASRDAVHALKQKIGRGSTPKTDALAEAGGHAKVSA